MASIGHVAVGLAARRWYERDQDLRWSAISTGVVWSGISLFPDIDVYGFRMGVPYGTPWGHRGATHSLMFAALAALVAWLVARAAKLPPLRTTFLVGVVVASHGLLDTLTTVVWDAPCCGRSRANGSSRLGRRFPWRRSVVDSFQRRACASRSSKPPRSRSRSLTGCGQNRPANTGPQDHGRRARGRGVASSEGGDARHSGVLRGCPARDPILVELLATAAPLPGAEAFTRLLAARRVPMAIATSTEAALFAIKAAPHRPW